MSAARNDAPKGARPTRRGWIALLVVLVLAAGVGASFLIDSDENGDDPSTATTPEATPEVTPTVPATVAGSGGFLDQPREEDWGTVHFEYEIERDDEDVLNVYFVAAPGASDAGILSEAKECVKASLEDYFGASCYGFDSEESLEAAAPNPQTGAMSYPCWRAFFSDSEAAQAPGQATAPKQTPEECS